MKDQEMKDGTAEALPPLQPSGQSQESELVMEVDVPSSAPHRSIFDFKEPTPALSSNPFTPASAHQSIFEFKKVGTSAFAPTSAHQASMFDFQHVGTSTNVPPVSLSSAHQPSIFDFQKPGRSPPASARQASIFDFQQVGTSTNIPPVPPSSACQPSIFDFQKPDIPAPASARQASIFDFQQVDTSTNVPPVPPSSARQPSIFDFQKPNNPAPASANKGSPFDFQVHRSFTPASAVQPSIDFQTPGTSAPAPASDKPGMSSPGASRSNSTLGSRKYLTKSQEAKLRLQGQGGAAILPTRPGDAFVFGPAPVFIYTQERTTPRPPPSTELLDLDPNSPRARGLCRKYNIKVVSDDSIGDRTGVVAEVVQAIGKVWERAMDPKASSDPSIRNLQATFDKLLTRGDEFTEMDRMDLVRHSEIHQEALRSLPDSIATTSHYRYVLATLRREKDRLREQIDSDRDLVAAMDATLEGLRPFIPDEIPDKGKGRDKRDGPGFK
ncbi:uncharacterized protein LACBIDRAFT_303629 [Laccaria bicolor S238N-H82]|uniref:Predicted protein n=1 Tax=Laccaria bicolor (strain S238N-H82 / ATCC MYA-4686) TaxID=486041 RepID=B0DJW5_LACBS|nr:uncharacterized protein LACBIDRAFT_303629 [Laccaria bicolor S238N-H82]EDR05278.1 predicted protein [Laccaria bicolor S238N-H82]|eukprot:XP_001884243.1 predicted protein [Laccaria bicolor S238N-H82]